MDGLELDVGIENLEKRGVVDSNDIEAEPVYVPRKREFRTAYLTEEEESELREIYSHSIVQDFNDTYHLSKKDREELERTQEKLIKFRKLNKKTRKIDKYIEIQRASYDALNECAETNGVLDPEDFKKRFAKGEIVINGLKVRPLTGKSKNNYNWDYIFDEYILKRDKDPSELLETNENKEEIDKSNKEGMKKLFCDIEDVTRELSDDEKKYRARAIINENEEGVVVECDKKTRKKIFKSCPSLIKKIKTMDEIDKKNERIRNSDPRAEYIYNEQFKFVEEYDKKRAKKDERYNNGIPQFHGDFNSDKDVENYLLRLKQYEMENELVEYAGKFYTKQKYQEIMLKDILDKNGWDIRKLSTNLKEGKKRNKHEKKRVKKEERLQSMLKKLSKKNDNKITKNILVNSKKKDIISKKKKKKVKKKHKKSVKQIDDLLLDITSKNKKKYKKFKNYKKEMEDFKWSK